MKYPSVKDAGSFIRIECEKPKYTDFVRKALIARISRAEDNRVTIEGIIGTSATMTIIFSAGFDNTSAAETFINSVAALIK